MSNSYRDIPLIVKLGLFDIVRGVNTDIESASNNKIITPAEAAIVLAEDELKKLMEEYECLDLTPAQISEYIEEEVIGQTEAVRKVVHVAYYNQMANLMHELGMDAPKRSNLLLIGPTGCGKTSCINALKKYFKVPIAKYSADSITSAGYIGNKVEDILIRLFEESGRNLSLAERGIIYIDEFDKKAEQATNSGKDINGRAVQEELLKILEPNRIDLVLSDKTRVPFDTSRLTVILGGAFVGLDEIRRKRLCKNSVGFKTNAHELSEEELMAAGYIPEDLIKFGFIPEIVGRIFMFAELRALKPEDIIKIMFEGKNSPYIEKSRFLANVLNVEQMISKKFLEKVAENLINTKTYARDLEAKMTMIFYPLIQIAFEHRNEYGICHIYEDGDYSIEYDTVTYYGEVTA